MTTAEQNTLIGLVAGMGIGLILFLAALLVLTIVAGWRIFKKAGEPGWKSIIPIYNVYIMFKIAWETKWFWITFALGVVYEVADTLRCTNPSGLITALLLISSIALLIVYILFDVNLAKSFNKSTGFAVGLVLLPTIFQLILGLGSSEYVGPMGIAEKK